MTGMNFAWFSIVNVVSAIVWAAAHIVPAAGVGRGLSRHLDIDIKTVAVGLVILIVGICLYLALRRRLWA